MYNTLDPPFYFEDIWGDTAALEALPKILSEVCNQLEDKLPIVELKDDTVSFNFPLSKTFLIDMGIPTDFPIQTFIDLSLEVMKDRLKYTIDELQEILNLRYPSNPSTLAKLRSIVERSDRLYKEVEQLNFGQSLAIKFGLSPAPGHHPVIRKEISEIQLKLQRLSSRIG
jgi:hypothetical protein